MVNTDGKANDLAVAWFGGYCRPRELAARTDALLARISER